jgi:hypothetical protein
MHGTMNIKFNVFFTVVKLMEWTYVRFIFRWYHKSFSEYHSRFSFGLIFKENLLMCNIRWGGGGEYFDDDKKCNILTCKLTYVIESFISSTLYQNMISLMKSRNIALGKQNWHKPKIAHLDFILQLRSKCNDYIRQYEHSC